MEKKKGESKSFSVPDSPGAKELSENIGHRESFNETG